MLLQMAFHSFLWLSSIPLCVCVCVCVCLFFIHSSVSGHLFTLLHVLAIINSAAMNVEVHVSFQIIVFSRYVLGGGIAGSYDSPIFSFLRNLCTVSIVAAQIYIPTGNAV